MKLFCMAIRDRQTTAFMNPFYVAHVGAAIRGFTDLINDGKSDLARHPEDYDLYQLGTFDDGTGMHEVAVPTQVSVGKNVYVPRSVPEVQTPGVRQLTAAEANGLVR